MIRSLKVGCKGIDVQVVQDALNYRRQAGDEVLVDHGDFGPRTRKAVVRFQERQGLVPDGVVGHWTRQALFPLVTCSCYLAVTRGGGDSTAVRSKASRDQGFGFGGGSKAKGGVGGDLPDIDPAPVPNQILPNLTFPTDPGDGPIRTTNIGGFSLPAPSLLPESIFGLPQDTGQVQAGGQFVTRHIWESKPGSSNPSVAAVLALQQVYARDKDQPGHVELALGVQLLAPIWATTHDGLTWGIQPYVQFTWADPFWRRGRFHLVAPFAQVTAQTDLTFHNPVLGIGLFPVNISFDLTDTISIIGQAGIVGAWDVNNKRGEVGASPALFGSWAF